MRSRSCGGRERRADSDSGSSGRPKTDKDGQCGSQPAKKAAADSDRKGAGRWGREEAERPAGCRGTTKRPPAGRLWACGDVCWERKRRTHPPTQRGEGMRATLEAEREERAAWDADAGRIPRQPDGKREAGDQHTPPRQCPQSEKSPSTLQSVEPTKRTRSHSDSRPHGRLAPAERKCARRALPHSRSPPHRWRARA